MIDRLIENWLDKSTEKSFQIPFSYILSAEGYKVIHVTRHCAMEQGKDIIAISPDGQPCAFQLKGTTNNKKIKLKQWQNELLGQCLQLITTPIAHPSIKSKEHHISYLVTNGEIEEEVFNSIYLFNKEYEEKGLPQYMLNTMVKGEIINKIKKYKEQFLPIEIEDFKTFLEVYLCDGKSNFPKAKFSDLLGSVICIKGKFNVSKFQRSITNAALFTSIILNEFSKNENYIAEIEAWTLYYFKILHLAECYNIHKKHYINEIELTENVLTNKLENLLEEVKGNEKLTQGNAMYDVFVIEARIVWVLGLLSALGLKYYFQSKNSVDIEFIKKLILTNIDKIKLIGEVSVSYILDIAWFLKITNENEVSNNLLTKVFVTLVTDIVKNTNLVSSPYLSFEETLLELGSLEKDAKNRIHFILFFIYWLNRIINSC
jgi:hypothetical protein